MRSLICVFPQKLSPFQVLPTTSSFADHLLVAAYASILHVFAAPTWLPPNVWCDINSWGIWNHHQNIISMALFSAPHHLMPTWFKMCFKSFMFLFRWPEGPKVLNVDACWWRSGVNAELTSHYSQSCNLFTSMKSTKRQTWPAISLDVPLLTALLQLCCGLFCFMPCT